MGKITINGKNYQGNNIRVNNDVVYIDGKKVDDDFTESSLLKVVVEGDINKVETDCSLEVKGNVEGNAKAGGSIRCGNIQGSVSAGGSVSCDDIHQNVVASGSVRASKITGNVQASGSGSVRGI